MAQEQELVPLQTLQAREKALEGGGPCHRRGELADRLAAADSARERCRAPPAGRRGGAHHVATASQNADAGSMSPIPVSLNTS
jgi:hypothetical protein